MFYKAERLWHRRQQSEATELMRRALELYRGEFLPDSTMTPWTYQMRERLRDIFVKCVLRIGEHYEKEGSLEDALHLYQRGIEMTPTQEELYQRLMLLYMKMDRKADAVLTYQRCFNTLKGILGVEPSEKTKDLYRDVREG
jgi:DNA-binding SARP family transcriptional activator